AAAGFKLSDIANVIVTHRHMDHAGGMQALILASRPVTTFALEDTHAGIDQVKAGCFPEWGVDNPQWGQQRERFNKVVAPGDVRDIGGFRVEFFEMVHRVPTVAVRVAQGGRVVAYSADSRPCEALVAAARGADLFLCDALFAESQGEPYAAQTRRLMHPTAREAGEMAKAADVKVLACVHGAANAEHPRIIEEASAAFGGPTLMPGDLSRLAV
ncbi:MAG: MBL fold metallo-hydrolase, partial [Hyphomicrobiaceae bacterium]